MGTIKVNNDEVWNDYVKTGKVKGFSIEGFFADKIEASKMNKKMNENKEADLLLSKITSILKGEKVELEKHKTELAARKISSILSDANKLDNKMKAMESKIDKSFLQYKNNYDEWIGGLNDIGSSADKIETDLYKVFDIAKEIGVDPKSIDGFSKTSDVITKLYKLISSSKKLYPSV